MVVYLKDNLDIKLYVVGYFVGFIFYVYSLFRLCKVDENIMIKSLYLLVLVISYFLFNEKFFVFIEGKYIELIMVYNLFEVLEKDDYVVCIY